MKSFFTEEAEATALAEILPTILPAESKTVPTASTLNFPAVEAESAI